ncbi:MAG: phosphoenolpyruvate carboxylase [Bdellovibrionales bacterium]|nr:phosphoenolpyruvate carboxylase [Bdellovibrionales bacterium]
MSIIIRNPEPSDFLAIQELCRKVYPFSKPWSLEQLKSHNQVFKEGQFVAVDSETNQIVGLAFSLVISWDDYSPRDSWGDFTSSGFFYNHSLKRGRTLYGAEVMVDPERRGQGIGKLLYNAREELARRFGIKRIRAGARLRGYHKFSQKMSPQEYVNQVVNKQVYDPTLSFQLGKGFVALDVAKNYLFNDPESLGYAAVIEWLNPEEATPKDFARQAAKSQAMKDSDNFISDELPKELRRLVRKVTVTLGEVIKLEEGESFFEKIEDYRLKLKKTRTKRTVVEIEKIQKRVSGENPDTQYKVAHGFSLLMELINNCENTYRSWRLRQKSQSQPTGRRIDLGFVLTAHPTEARSPSVVEFSSRVSEIVMEGLVNNFRFDDDALRTYLRLLWLIPLSKLKSPTVEDEAEYLYSILFNPKILEFILSENVGFNIRIRSWVGGDKDGHPGVNERTMLASLSRSRKHLILAIKRNLDEVCRDLELVYKSKSSGPLHHNKIKGLQKRIETLKKVTAKDGANIEKWYREFEKYMESAPDYIEEHRSIHLTLRIFELFPALVVPLEFREDADEIREGLKDQSKTLGKMLKTLKSISQGGNPEEYCRGLVISHCESANDIEDAKNLAKKCLGGDRIPIIPLFETRAALTNSARIVKEWLSDSKNLTLVQRVWRGKFEIMLGYSDSAKEIGVLSSRTLIQKAMHDLDAKLRRRKLIPIFFHGSGGSVARGGGRLKDQISWWPDSAVRSPKMTIQGEMVQRTFSTPEILSSQCHHFSQEARSRLQSKHKNRIDEIWMNLAKVSEGKYKAVVDNPTILGQLLSVTPYKHLSVLKIGSRPSKRPSEDISTKSLRAIPWVMCWTQTRILLPTWWGVGSAWSEASESDKKQIIEASKLDPSISSFVKSVSFTLAKVDLAIWEIYLKAFLGRASKDWIVQFQIEYQKCAQFVKEMSGQESLLWHRPWLEESIRLRSPYINILNLLQIEAMKRNDDRLLRETIVGVACGMLTTG